MFLEVEDLLTPSELEYALNLSLRTEFSSGRSTNPKNITKHNLQANITETFTISGMTRTALQRNTEVNRFAFPKQIQNPMLTKYEEGMYYGLHCDTPFIQNMRTDISCTVFLHDPNIYVGGELRIHLGNGYIDFKPKAGNAILYPSTTLHEVLPVRRGERLALITFIESSVADPRHREILYNLNKIKERESENLSWDSRTLLNHSVAMLERMWKDNGR